MGPPFQRVDSEDISQLKISVGPPFQKVNSVFPEKIITYKVIKDTQVDNTPKEVDTSFERSFIRESREIIQQIDSSINEDGPGGGLKEGMDDSRPNNLSRSNKSPLTFDEACRKVKKLKPKKRKVKQVTNLGKSVNFTPSYYACVAPRKERNKNNNSVSASVSNNDSQNMFPDATS